MKLKTILLGSGCIAVNVVLIKKNLDKKKRINNLRGGKETTFSLSGQVLDEENVQVSDALVFLNENLEKVMKI